MTAMTAMTAKDALIGLYNACDPLKPATPEQYVDCSAARGIRTLENIFCRRLERAERTSQDDSEHFLRFLFSGHVGSGKSSELVHLRRTLDNPPRHRSNYVTILLDALDYLNMDDTTPLDLLLAMVVEIGSALREKRIEISLTGTVFQRRFRETLKEALPALELEKLEVGGKFDWGEIKVGFKRLQKDESSRKKVRDAFKTENLTISEALNDLLREARRQMSAQGIAGLILIVDNLERIRRVNGEVDEEKALRDLYISHASLWTGIDAHVLYTVPLRLLGVVGQDLRNSYGEEPVVLPMIAISSPGSNTNTHHLPGWACLVSVLEQRLAGTGVPLLNAAPGEGSVLSSLNLAFGENGAFEPAALEELIGYSGGHVRSLLIYVREACDQVDALPITLRAARRSLSSSVANFTRTIPATWYAKLAELHGSQTRRIDPADEDLRTMVEQVIVLEYRNGYGEEQDSPEPWFAVNPVVQNLSGFKEALKDVNGRAN